MSGRLNVGSQEITEPAARLDSPGLAVVDLTRPGASYLAFTAPGAAREVAAACTRAADCSKARKWSKHDPRVRACPARPPVPPVGNLEGHQRLVLRAAEGHGRRASAR